MQLDVIDQRCKKIRSLDVAPSVADKINKAVLYYAFKAQRNNLRHGTVKTKTRSEVKMTNKKVYRQKGTGNARHGARSANIFVGGGNVFGPNPRSYFEHLNRKMRVLSYAEAFKYLIQNDTLKIVDDFIFEKPSTKAAAEFLKNAGCVRALVILPSSNENAKLSFRNLRDVTVLAEHNLNLPDILSHDFVVVTASFFEEMKGRYGL